MKNIYLVLLFISLPAHAEIRTVVRSGQLAFDQGQIYFDRLFSDRNNIAFPPPALNENGTSLYYVGLDGPGTSTSNHKAVFLGGDLGSSLVARQYTTIPLESSVIYSEIQSARLSQVSDEALLLARLGGAGVTSGLNDFGVFRSTWGLTELFARKGDLAPDSTPSGTFSSFLSIFPGPDVSRHSMYSRIRLTSNNTLADGVWSPGAQYRSRIQQHGVAPGTEGATLTTFTTLSDEYGNLLYLGNLTGGDSYSYNVNGVTITNNQALWVEGGDWEPTMIARLGSLPTGEDSPAVISQFWSDSRIASFSTPDGAVIFGASLVDSDTGVSLGIGIWNWKDGLPNLLLQTGSEVEQHPELFIEGIYAWGLMRHFFAGDNGSATILATLSGEGVDSTNRYAVVRGKNNSARILARGGDQAPGTPEGVSFRGDVLQFRSSASGSSTVIVANLLGDSVTPGNDFGVWLAQGGNLELALREGDIIGDLRIVEIVNTPTHPILVNDQGHIIARCDLAWANDPASTRYTSIVSWAPGDGGKVIAQTGQPLMLSEGGTGPVMTLHYSPHQSLNNHGELLFRATMLSSSRDEGLFIATISDEAPSCPADYNESGSATVEDIFAFLSDWFSGNGDFNGSGQTDVQDIFAFLSVWFVGCPG